MHTKTIKIAVLLTCFASLSASANPIGDALGKIINWGQNTLHPADPASSAVASAAANSLAAGGTLNTFWNPFTAKPIATPTDAKLKVSRQRDQPREGQRVALRRKETFP